MGVATTRPIRPAPSVSTLPSKDPLEDCVCAKSTQMLMVVNGSEPTLLGVVIKDRLKSVRRPIALLPSGTPSRIDPLESEHSPTGTDRDNGRRRIGRAAGDQDGAPREIEADRQRASQARAGSRDDGEERQE